MCNKPCHHVAVEVGKFSVRVRFRLIAWLQPLYLHVQFRISDPRYLVSMPGCGDKDRASALRLLSLR